MRNSEQIWLNQSSLHEAFNKKNKLGTGNLAAGGWQSFLHNFKQKESVKITFYHDIEKKMKQQEMINRSTDI